MKKFWIILIVIVLISIIGYRVVVRLMSDGSTVTEEIYVTVEGETVKKGTIEDYAILNGTVSANQTVSIIPTMPALVSDIKVAVGEVVKEGNQLFQLDTDNMDNQVSQAEYSVESANSGLEQAKLAIENAKITASQAQIGYDVALANYDSSMEKYKFSVDNLAKYKELLDAGIVSQSEYDQMELQASESTKILIEKQLEQAAQSLSQANIAVENANLAYEQALSGVERAEDGQTQAEDALSDMTFTAPINGVVASINLTEDVYASTAAPAMVIEDIDTVKIGVAVSESIVNKLQKGEQAEVILSALGDETFIGEIITISPSANSRTLLFDITLKVDNPDHLIKPGMFAKVNLRTDIKENTFIINGSGIFYNGSKTFVYVQNGENSVEQREVTLGVDNGEQVEILSGLTEEDIYIYKGVSFLQEDSVIKMIRGDQK